MPHSLKREKGRGRWIYSLGGFGGWSENEIPHECILFMSGITSKLISQGVLEK